MKVTNRLFALLLAVVMVLSLIPTVAFAEDQCTTPEVCTAEGHAEGCALYVTPTPTTCPGDDTCTVTEGHIEGCPSYVPAPATCPGDDSCTAAEGHIEGCPSYVPAPATCPGDDSCTVTEGHIEGCPSYVPAPAICPGDDSCTVTEGHIEGCPNYVPPCTHSYGPWSWFVDEANEENNTFLRACLLCQEEERNYTPEEIVRIMTATPEDAYATKATLEQAVVNNILTQEAADMLIDTLGIMPTENMAKIGTTEYATLADAMKAVGADGTATIELFDGTHVLPAGNPDGGNWNNLDITFTGSENAIIKVPGMVYNDSGKFTFDGVTVSFPSTGSNGIAHIAEIAYKDCVINGVQYMFAVTSQFTSCVFSNKSDYCVWTYAASNGQNNNLTFTDCVFNTGGKAVLVYNHATVSNYQSTVTLSGCIFNSDGSLATDKAAVEAGSNGGNTATSNRYFITISGCTASNFATNKSTSPLWGNKNEMDHEHLIVNLNGTEVTAPYVDMSGITLNNKVYDGKMLSYTGKAIVRTYSGELKDANNNSYAFTYEWYEKQSDGSYQKMQSNAAPKEVGEYMLLATTKDFADLEGSILVKIEKAPAPVTNTNTNTNTIYVYSETKLLQTGVEALPLGLMAFAGIFALAAGLWLLGKKSYGR